MNWFWGFAPLFLAFVLGGCGGGYRQVAIDSWPSMARGDQERALENYEKRVTRKQDALLRLMDEGILHRTAGDFHESNKKFLEAARLLETRDYLSLTGEALELVADARTSFYQGEDFEKVLVHLYLALNFLELGDLDAALVETRVVNQLMTQFISEAKRPYNLNAFARYLGGLIYERDGEFNDAWIAYRATEEILARSHSALDVDIVRMGRRLGFREELEVYKSRMSKEDWDLAEQGLRGGFASVVLIFEAGKSPMKVSRREHHQHRSGTELTDFVFPLAEYRSRPSRISSARLIVEGADAKAKAETEELFSVEETARQHLSHRMGVELTKAAVRAAVKTGVAVGVGKLTDSPEMGILAGLLLFAATDADTRSWLLLPESFQVARLYLRPGDYDVRFEFLDRGGKLVQSSEAFRVSLKPHQILFFQERSFL